MILGSIGILFPAWLPDSPVLPAEDGIVESLQVILLVATGAFWFGAARTALHLGPFYQIFGTLAIASAIGESQDSIQQTLNIHFSFLYIPLIIFALIKFFAHKKHLGAFIARLTSHPAAGFFASAFIMIYVLARFLGTSLLWKASLGDNYHSDIPLTVSAYLELLACYFLLIGTIGLCLTPQPHDITAID